MVAYIGVVNVSGDRLTQPDQFRHFLPMVIFVDCGGTNARFFLKHAPDVDLAH